MIEQRDVFYQTVKPIATATSSYAVWKILTASGITSISPITVGFAGGVYCLVHELASSIFDRMFKISSSVEGYKSSACYIMIQLTSAAATVLVIHALGLLTLSTFTVFTPLELLAFLKGVDYLVSSETFSRAIDNFVRIYILDEPGVAPVANQDTNSQSTPAPSSPVRITNTPPPQPLRLPPNNAAHGASSLPPLPQPDAQEVFPWSGQEVIMNSFGYPQQYTNNGTVLYFSHIANDGENIIPVYNTHPVPWAGQKVTMNRFNYPDQYTAQNGKVLYFWNMHNNTPVYRDSAAPWGIIKNIRKINSYGCPLTYFDPRIGQNLRYCGYDENQNLPIYKSYASDTSTSSSSLSLQSTSQASSSSSSSFSPPSFPAYYPYVMPMSLSSASTSSASPISYSSFSSSSSSSSSASNQTNSREEPEVTELPTPVAVPDASNTSVALKAAYTGGKYVLKAGKFLVVDIAAKGVIGNVGKFLFNSAISYFKKPSENAAPASPASAAADSNSVSILSASSSVSTTPSSPLTDISSLTLSSLSSSSSAASIPIIAPSITLTSSKPSSSSSLSGASVFTATSSAGASAFISSPLITTTSSPSSSSSSSGSAAS